MRNGAQSKASVPIVRPISYNHIRPYGAGGTRPFQLWRTWGLGAKCTGSHSTFATGYDFLAGKWSAYIYSASPDILTGFKGR